MSTPKFFINTKEKHNLVFFPLLSIKLCMAQTQHIFTEKYLKFNCINDETV